MTVSPDLIGEWVGMLHTGDHAEFVHAVFTENGTALFDYPNQFLFHIPAEGLAAGVSRMRWVFRDPSGRLSFDGRLLQGSITGKVSGSRSGQLALHRVFPLSEKRFKRMMGIYELSPTRMIQVAQDCREHAWITFYQDGDRVMRMFPIGPSSFMAVHGEALSFQDGALAFSGSDGAVSTAPRLNAYREQPVSIPVADYVLAGTLLLPPGEGLFPGVVICHGSDTSQRDFYRLYAVPFVQRGIAALIYDKRGSGESTGEQLYSQMFPLSDDAAAVYRFLQAHPVIQPDRVGFWGYSNGGMVAPLAASRVGDVAFVVMLSTLGFTPARQEQIRRTNVVRDLGASPEAVALIERFWGLVYQYAVYGQWDDDLPAVIEAVNTSEELQRLPKRKDHAPRLQAVPPILNTQEVKAEDRATWAEGGFETRDVCRKLSCPLLFVWGETDNVLPVGESVARMKEAMLESQHPDYEIHVIPNANHKLFLETARPSGMTASEMHTLMYNVQFASGALDLMADWMREKV